ncbi:MAG: 4-(cytidine 5'-diphospho)-2-C-methyl-D-erythritol kinase [Planctomycetes bacterium]|nr:4-(cytidine 5'-diphospho)-2-C-methyl-D-erythritol kinase [Planctomycetota bacterium]
MFTHRCGDGLAIFAPAKLNLFLEVLARRADGYHEIETLMAPVSLYDHLTFRPRADVRLTLTCRLAPYLTQPGQAALPVGPDNLVLRALERLRERAGHAAGADVTLSKSIPWEAGLAGGSSNAAAALLLANEGWQLGWSRERLVQVAAELGSDIPFFFGHGAAICRGRGEQIESVAGLAGLHAVIVKPPVGLSTAAVYKSCRPAEEPRRATELVSTLRAGNWAGTARSLFNRLQAPAEQLCDAVSQLKSRFAQLNCVAHQMSGSGTSYFGLFRSAAQARRAASLLRSLAAWQVFQVECIV